MPRPGHEWDRASPPSMACTGGGYHSGPHYAVGLHARQTLAQGAVCHTPHGGGNTCFRGLGLDASPDSYDLSVAANLARARAQSRLDAIEVAALEAQEALRMKSRHERRKKEQREQGYRG
eukprot:scaffold525_cov124-Isochrysis_galbana.AAC.2